jgi:hypothetical protein
MSYHGKCIIILVLLNSPFCTPSMIGRVMTAMYKLGIIECLVQAAGPGLWPGLWENSAGPAGPVLRRAHSLE